MCLADFTKQNVSKLPPCCSMNQDFILFLKKIFIYFKLAFNCFTMLCCYLLDNNMNQLKAYIYPLIPFYGWIISHCLAMPHFLFISWWIFGWLSVFCCYEWCCYERLCTGFCVHVFFNLLSVCLKVELLSCMVTLFNSWRSYHTVFQSSWPCLHSPWTRVPISPPLVNTWFCQSSIIVFLVGMKLYVIVVLICISLMTDDIGHLITCLSSLEEDIHVSSLEKCLFKSFVITYF